MSTFILFSLIVIILLTLRIALHDRSFEDLGSALVSLAIIIFLVAIIVFEIQYLFPQLK